MSYEYTVGVYILMALAPRRNAVGVDNAYVKIGGTVVNASATIKNIETPIGNDYIDLIVDVEFKFNSNGGTVEEAYVKWWFIDNYNAKWFVEMCAKPGVTVGSGSATLNQRFITRFYTRS